MSWQKCPICNGEGRILATGYTSSIYNICPTCHGQRILSELNGLAPAVVVPKEEKFCDIVRFTLNQRMKDPQITIEEIENLWKNRN